MRQVVAGCLVVLAACTASVRAPQGTATFPENADASASGSVDARVCRSGNPLANVYASYRLRVINRCTTVKGVVTRVKREPDQDFHVDLRLDPEFDSMLNSDNRSKQRGELVLEIVPADQSICVSGSPSSRRYAICTGANLRTPAVGQHIVVSGPFVTDQLHGWNEIHPVWSWHAG